MMLPILTDEQTWFDSLIVDFPRQNIPYLVGMDWKTCGNSIVELSLFKKNHAPGTEGYEDWSTWAQDFFNTMEDVQEF